MMKRNYLQILVSAIALTGLMACSDRDDVKGESAEGGYTCRLELTAASDGSGQSGTRTLSLNGKQQVMSMWDSSDKLVVYNLSDADRSNATNYSMLETKSSGGKSATFTGNVVSVRKLKQTDKLVFFYPGAALEGEKTVEQVDPVVHEESVQGGQKLKYHVSESKIRSFVSLDMKQQDGMLETIDRKYDYNWAVASPELVSEDGTIVKAKASLSRKITIWGMKFTDGANDLTDIDSVKVNGLRSYDVLNLSNGSFAGTDDEKEYNINVFRKNRKLMFQGGYVWLAFLAEDSTKQEKTNFTITVYTGNGVYTKSAAKFFKEGYDYRSVITVTKIVAKPFVVVNNVKWATGNFIHYKKGQDEYWGIAPAQWWISNYGDTPLGVNNWNGKAQEYSGLGSQFWHINGSGGYTMTSNDMDLFRYGDIGNALDLTSNTYLYGTAHILARLYYRDRGVNTKTNNRDEAMYGDIVWYWTNDGNHYYKYMYPSKEQVADLLDPKKTKTIMPAYCYTDKGNKVYGAYFSDRVFAGVSGKKNFPTGKKLWKYQDVTGLVLANEGLFLPITGRTEDHSPKVVYRYVDKGSEFYALYMTSHCTAIASGTVVKFGSFGAGYSSQTKNQGCPIRPVYVGPDNDDLTTPVDAARFAPFNEIVDTNGRKY